MRKEVWPMRVYSTWWLASILSAGILLLAACGGSSGNGKTSTRAALTTTTNQVKINEQDEKYRFDPAVLTIAKGTTVVWTNTSDAPHTVTSETGTLVASTTITPSGGTFRFTFTQPGTYLYHCTIHPYMQGTIVVTG